MVHGLRKVSVCLQLHPYRPPTCEMQRLLRSGLLLGPSPEDGRDDYVGWRILQMRCAHALYLVDEAHSATPKLNCRPPLFSDSAIVQNILAAPCHHLLPVNASLHVPRSRGSTSLASFRAHEASNSSSATTRASSLACLCRTSTHPRCLAATASGSRVLVAGGQPASSMGFTPCGAGDAED